MHKTFEEVVTFENLYKAYISAKRGKSKKPEVILFKENLNVNLIKLFKKVRSFTFDGFKYDKFYISYPKKRLIHAPSFEARIVQHMLCDYYLTPLIERHCIYDNAACRKNKGTDFARQRLEKFMNAYKQTNGNINGYILQIDIKKYFQSINHLVLKEKLLKIVKDKKLYKLLSDIIDSYSNENAKDKGLALGNQTSQNFALYYLDNIDRLIKEKYQIKYYIRYMDDFIIIHKDKNHLKALLSEINEEFKKLDVLINEKKTFIQKLAHGISFVGYNFKFNKKLKLVIKVKKKTLERVLKNYKRAKYFSKNSKEGKEYFNNLINSLNSVFEKEKNYNSKFHKKVNELRAKNKLDVILKREKRINEIHYYNLRKSKSLNKIKNKHKTVFVNYRRINKPEDNYAKVLCMCC